MQASRRQLCLLAYMFCLVLALPLVALAQTTAPAPLSPEAQAAVDKGVLAAKQQDYLLAVRYFQDARKLAPQSPEIYFDLGLAESKIPGRELRAIAWFGAYLAASPNAANAAAVKAEVDRLDIKNQINISHLIQTVQDAAILTSDQEFNSGTGKLDDVARLWLKVGDLPAALKTADLHHVAKADGDLIADKKSQALSHIAVAQAEAGDIAGAQKTFQSALRTSELIQSENLKSGAQGAIAVQQARGGDFTGAEKTAALMHYGNEGDSEESKSSLQISIAEAQLELGDIAGAKGTTVVALKIASSIQKASAKCFLLFRFVRLQARLGDIAGAKESLASSVKACGLKGITYLYNEIAEAQLKVGDIEGARDTLGSMIKYADSNENSDKLDIDTIRSRIAKAEAEANSPNKSASSPSPPAVAQSPIQPTIPNIKVSDWVGKLDENRAYGECALNTDPFLDLAGYLTAQRSDDPNRLFSNLRYTAEKIIKAQNVIDKMLKQQARQ